CLPVSLPPPSRPPTCAPDARRRQREEEDTVAPASHSRTHREAPARPSPAASGHERPLSVVEATLPGAMKLRRPRFTARAVRIAGLILTGIVVGTVISNETVRGAVGYAW